MSVGPATLLRQDMEGYRYLLRVLEGLAGAFHQGHSVPREDLEAALDAVSAMDLRHRKEDKAVFAALRKADRQRALPVLRKMQDEPGKAESMESPLRIHLEAAAGNDVRAQVEWERGALRYAAWEREHLQRDVRFVLPLADDLLDGAAKLELAGKLHEMADSDKDGRLMECVRDLGERYAHYAAVAA